ncbi:MATE family efflux transporter [Reinekea thalattae]|uniref:MATE family efflux transporter n=1 Tax=Reinekea thalattae TaxID=2593301 RepID=A0A5C8ZAL5_9GAMM|nr:MATE family efflux transporter [Reinekea thalattae]TXR54193.1 MATE family efflux transporter [Reinekea thalattae]
MKNELFEQPIPKLVVKKILQMSLGILAIQMFALVDTWFIAFLGTEPLAAVSFTFPVVFTVSSLSIGLAIGVGASVGRLLGQGEILKAQRFTTDSLILATFLVAVLSAFGILFMNPLFTAMGSGPEMLVLIREYMLVWFIGIPFLVLPMQGNAAIRASGDIKTPSKVMFLAGLLNAGLDPIFIFWLDMGIRGAAIATLVAWMISFCVAFYMLRYRLKLITFEQFNFETLLKNWQQLMKIGLPAALTQMLSPITAGIIISMLSAYGVASVAAFGVGVRIEAILLIFVMATGGILPTILGQNYGAKNYQRSAEAIRFILTRVTLLYLLLYFVVFIFARPISRIFTSDPDVIELAVLYLRIIPLSYCGMAATMILAQIYNTLHRSMTSLVITLLRISVFVIPMTWFGARVAQTLGVYVGLASAQLISGVIFFVVTLRLANKISQQTVSPLEQQAMETAK